MLSWKWNCWVSNCELVMWPVLWFYSLYVLHLLQRRCYFVTSIRVQIQRGVCVAKNNKIRKWLDVKGQIFDLVLQMYSREVLVLIDPNARIFAGECPAWVVIFVRSLPPPPPPPPTLLPHTQESCTARWIHPVSFPLPAPNSTKQVTLVWSSKPRLTRWPRIEDCWRRCLRADTPFPGSERSLSMQGWGR